MTPDPYTLSPDEWATRGMTARERAEWYAREREWEAREEAEMLARNTPRD